MRDKCERTTTIEFTIIRRIILLLVISNLNITLSHGTEPIWVEPFNITFNYEAGQTNDALTIRKANGTPITDPEWASYHNYYENENFAYIKAQSNRKIRVTFDSNCEDMHLVIKLTVTSGTGIGEVCNLFVCNYHQLDEITLTLNGTLPDSVGKRTFTWRWEIYGIPVNDPDFCADWETTETTHTYYTLLATPQAPMTEPWSSVLDYACVWASGQNTKEDAASQITIELFNCGFQYDLIYGASTFTSTQDNTKIEVSWLLAGLSSPTSYSVNCVDISRSIVCFCNAIGHNLKAKRLIRAGNLITYNTPIPVNCIDLIGNINSPTNDPFETDNIEDDCRKGGFTFHAFAYDSISSSVWDATFKYDIYGYPDDVENSGPQYYNSCGNVNSVNTWILPCEKDEDEYIDGILDDWIKPNGLYAVDCENPSDCVSLSTDNFTIK